MLWIHFNQKAVEIRHGPLLARDGIDYGIDECVMHRTRM